ncbi:hypothetical protein D9757_005742 [Collybiopsis confluens]|uniref:Uncharacterized protein n=1 Tax=Collybiopsis confluens TaxID=2823264 RepID=A0A8H5HQF4_9AGAR|nr:hypothetical protein D9757_005742 [Collybiopsis confluens]
MITIQPFTALEAGILMASSLNGGAQSPTVDNGRYPQTHPRSCTSCCLGKAIPSSNIRKDDLNIEIGHHKPLAALVALILESRPEAIVTYLATGPLFSKIQNELRRLEPVRYKAIKSRLNIIDNPRIPPQRFAPAYAALHMSEAITCLSPGETITSLPSPTLATIDSFCFYVMEFVRSISKDITILLWWSAPVDALLRLLGPPSTGGYTDPSTETPEGRAALKAKIFAEEKIEMTFPGNT